MIPNVIHLSSTMRKFCHESSLRMHTGCCRAWEFTFERNHRGVQKLGSMRTPALRSFVRYWERDPFELAREEAAMERC
jgi:hypothetical protein